MAKKKLAKSSPTKTDSIRIPQVRYNPLANTILVVVSILFGIYTYYENSQQQIYLAKKQIYNPIYQQLHLSLREFYSSTSLFFGNKGKSPNPHECIVNSHMLSTSLYQVKAVDKEIYQQVEDFMLKWISIPVRVWQHQNYPENWPNPNISDKDYLEYDKKMEEEFLSLGKKIAERISIEK